MTASSGRRRSGGLLGKLSERFTDPKKVGGSIDRDTGLIDPKRAILLQEVAVAEVGMERADKGEGVFAIELTGVINTVGDAANVLVLASPDSAALLLAQITAVARAGNIGAEFDHCLVGRMEEAIGG